MNVEDKTSIPGYIYFRDNERDLKIGLTNNLVVRGAAYETHNPRDTVLDYFSVETYAQAEAIEAEMKQAASAEGRCSFPDHPKRKEWLVRTEETKAFWDRFKTKYAKKTYAEWHEEHGTALESELQEAIDDCWKWDEAYKEQLVNSNAKLSKVEKEREAHKETIKNLLCWADHKKTYEQNVKKLEARHLELEDELKQWKKTGRSFVIAVKVLICFYPTYLVISSCF